MDSIAVSEVGLYNRVNVVLPSRGARIPGYIGYVWNSMNDQTPLLHLGGYYGLEALHCLGDNATTATARPPKAM